MRTFIKTTADGRPVEVIGTTICLAGKPEANGLVPVWEHPNVVAILTAVPDATHMAGRLPLTSEEAGTVTAALEAGEEEVLKDPARIAERFRLAAMRKARDEGIE
jgi:hypothetical protein